MRKFVAVGLAVALVALGAGCGSSDDTTSGSGSDGTSAGSDAGAEGKKVTFVGPIAAPVWLDANKAFEAEAKNLGMDPSWVVPSEIDIPGNVQAIESAITAGADGIATCALDPEAYAVALEEAKERDVPVVLVDCDTTEKDLRTAFVGTVGQTFGEKTAQHLIEKAGDSGEIITLQTSLDVPIQNEILEGFEAGIAGSGWEIVASETDDSDVQKAIEKLEALLRTHPNTSYVYCVEAICPEAAATVIKERNLDTKVIGIDDQEATLEGIKDGIVTFSSAQPFGEMGTLAARYLADAISGEEVPSVTDTGVLFVEKDNVASYKTEPAE
jgi:simple sugar transport system substrate-binding protein